jgi:hypothetical protein
MLYEDGGAPIDLVVSQFQPFSLPANAAKRKDTMPAATAVSLRLIDPAGTALARRRSCV